MQKLDLYYAAETGDLKKVITLLSKKKLFWIKKVNVNQQDDKGRTPLFAACQNGHLKVAVYLIEHGANINVAAHDKTTPLFIACQYGHLQVVQVLFANNTNVKVTNNDGMTLLSVACQNGHLDLVKYFVKHGAKVDEKMHDGATPIFMACKNGNLDVIKYLVENGAKVDEKMHNGATPVFMACQNGHFNLLKDLVKNGAKIDSVMNDGTTLLYAASQYAHSEVVQYLIEHKVDIDVARDDGTTPFFMACQNGHLKVVNILLTQGVDIEAATKNSRKTSLYIASQNGHFNIVKCLVEGGAKIDIVDNKGTTALFIASQNGHREAVAMLLTKGADAKIANHNNTTPLSTACQNGHCEVVKLLLAKEVNTEVANNSGATPLFLACYKGNLEIAKELLAYNANTDVITRNNGMTPLHIASKMGYLEVVQCLVNFGADIDKGTHNGATPLYLASEKNHFQVVQYFVDCNARVDAAISNGMTPLLVASNNGSTDVVQYLLENGANATAKTSHSSASVAEVVSRSFFEHENKGKEIEINIEGGTAGHKAVVAILLQHLRNYPSGSKPIRRYTSKQMPVCQPPSASFNPEQLVPQPRVSTSEDARRNRSQSNFRMSSIIITPRMQMRKLIGNEYYQMTTIKQKEAVEILEEYGLKIPFDPEEKEKAFILGRGNFGTIKIAFRKKTGEYVVSKKVKGTEEINKSKAEAYVQKEAAGENVLPIYNTIELKNMLYHFMPLAGLGNGRNVQAILAYAEPDVRQQALLYIAHDVLTGLKTQHEKNIFHLDIKPENIVFTKNGTCFITDFGCAKKPEEPGKNTQLSWDNIGDNRYFPAERYRASLEQTFFWGDKADAWAAGLTLLETMKNIDIFNLLDMPGNTAGRFNTCDERFFAAQLAKIPEIKRANLQGGIMAVLKGLLEPNHEQRLTVQEALEADCFKSLDLGAKKTLFSALIAQTNSMEQTSLLTQETSSYLYSSEEDDKYYQNPYKKTQNFKKPSERIGGNSPILYAKKVDKRLGKNKMSFLANCDETSEQRDKQASFSEKHPSGRQMSFKN